ncbi:DUF998 domain-containing protein [Chryseolinea sp. T2]|uniref:DUF998 domain-containing protein n=1 Tax=Chryseolinea sp. T2 TaxID=3129255 RepID=UPI0030785C20
MTVIAQVNTTSGVKVLAAKLSIIAASISIVALFGLHVLSPEFGPSWRMVSEYANGSFEWLLFVFFIFWGLSSWALAIALWPYVASVAAKFGVIALVISGLGTILAAFFNVNHPLHGLTGTLGIPTFVVAALLVSYHLRKKTDWTGKKNVLIWSAHATWMSVVLVVVTMIIMINGFKEAGIVLGPSQKPPASVPVGVVALVGYANRLLIAAYIGWLLLVSSVLLNIYKLRSSD